MYTFTIHYTVYYAVCSVCVHLVLITTKCTHEEFTVDIVKAVADTEVSES